MQGDSGSSELGSSFFLWVEVGRLVVWLNISVEKTSLSGSLCLRVRTVVSSVSVWCQLAIWNTRGRFYCALCWLKNTEKSVWKSFWSTRGRFYCALCWMNNIEQSVWKSFCRWLRFPTFVCFQSFAPVSSHQNSLKNLNSPTSPSFLSPNCRQCRQSWQERSGRQCQSIWWQSQPIRTRVPLVSD